MGTKTLFTGAIQALIARYSLKRVFVAVSGGIDSMCLIACLNELKHNLINCAPFDFSAVTIDHPLRDESQEEAYKTSMYLKSKGIDSVVIKWDHKQDSKLIKNMHQKARDARYSLLIEYCRKKNVDCLLTAHNKDDQAETVIMHIMRGSGVDGIAGIPSICKRSEVKIIRPFLEFSRAQIESVYKEIGWDYFVKDPSNENPKYTRASIRAQLKKHLDDNKYIELINRLELLAENAKRAKDFLHNVTVDTFSAICKTSELGVISMNIQKFIHLHEEIRLRLLVHILRSVSGMQHPHRLNSIKLLDTQICSIECLSDRTLAGCQIVQHLEVLVFFREKSKITQDKQHLMLGDNIWDKRFLIHVNQKVGDNLIKELYVKCCEDLHGTLVSKFTPPVAAIPEVRNALLDVQRNFPCGKRGVVIEGRDIGTVIFQKADVKVFITADLEVRAERRFKQLQNAGENIIHDQVLCDLRERDLKDSSRELAPLKLGAPYNVIDTTHITLGESVEKILELIPEVYFKKSK